MAELVSLAHVGLHSKGGTLSLSVEEGQSICIVGPAASGKSRLAALFARAERPVRGSITTPPSVSYSARQDVSRRSKPMSLARRAADDAGKSTEVLNELGLWEVRQKPISHLSEAQASACELIEPLGSRAKLIVLDGTLDCLDPWVLQGAFRLLARRLGEGAVAVVATNRPELVERFDAVIVLREQTPVFAGSPSDLLKRADERRLEISTLEPDGVRALVDPYEVHVQKAENGSVTLQTREGQEVAAKLLLEGYGSVKYVVTSPPTIEDALRAIV